MVALTTDAQHTPGLGVGDADAPALQLLVGVTVPEPVSEPDADSERVVLADAAAEWLCVRDRGGVRVPEREGGAV